MNRDFSYAAQVLEARARTNREMADQPRVAGYLSEDEWSKSRALLAHAESCDRAIKLLELHNEFSAVEEQA